MKDIIKIGMFVAVEEPSGKTAKAVGKIVGKVLEKYEANITSVVDAITELAVHEFKVEEKKDESK
jgi:hypothetical protein